LGYGKTQVAARQNNPNAADGNQLSLKEARLKTVDRKGGFYERSVTIPRSDLKTTIQGIVTPTSFASGGWVALSKGNDGADVMMGDLMLTGPGPRRSGNERPRSSEQRPHRAEYRGG
jgi:hypothetical protein